MDNFWSNALMALMFLLSVKDGLGDHCSNDNVDQCWEPVEDYMALQGYDLNDREFSIFELSEHETKTYCSIYLEQTSPCLADLVGHCPWETRKEFEGVEDAEDFACNDGLQEYLKHKSCIGSSTTQNKIQRCADQLDREINSIAQQYLTTSEAKEKACKAVYDALACDKKAVGDQCGKEAGEWMETYERKLNDPLLEHYGCDPDGTSSGPSKTVIIGGSVGGIIPFILIICCFGYLCKSSQKRKQGSAANNPIVVYNNRPEPNGGYPPMAAAPVTIYPDKADAPRYATMHSLPPKY